MALRIRLSKYDRIWSKMVRDRDKCCRKCKRTAPWKLEAHHIMPRGRKSTRLDLQNGMTLCVMCHKFGPEAVHVIGSKDFMYPLIGEKEYKRLEQLSLKRKSERDAVKEFQAIIEKYRC